VWVTRVDAARKGLRTIGINPSTGIAAGEGAVWVVESFQGAIVPIDLHTTRALTQISNLDEPTAAVIAYGRLWVTDSVDDSVLMFDPATGHREGVIPLPAGSGPSAIAAGEHGIWVLDRLAWEVTHISPRGTIVPAGREISLCCRPYGIAAGDGAVWVTARFDNRILRIDPATNQVSGQLPRLTDDPTVIAAGSDGLWVGGSLSRSLWHLSPSGKHLDQIMLAGPPTAVVDSGASVWVTVGPR
jgi:streptogramin lyase